MLDEWVENAMQITTDMKLDPCDQETLKNIFQQLAKIDECANIDGLLGLKKLLDVWQEENDEQSLLCFSKIAIAIISDIVLFDKQCVYTGILITTLMCFSYKKSEKSFYLCFTDFEELLFCVISNKGLKRSKTVDVDLEQMNREINELLDSAMLHDALAFTYNNRQKKIIGSHSAKAVVEISGLSSTIKYEQDRLCINTYAQGLCVFACPPEPTWLDFLEDTLVQFILQAQFAQRQIRKYGRPQTKKTKITCNLPNMKNRSIAACLIIGFNGRSSRGDSIIQMIKDKSKMNEINDNLKNELRQYRDWSIMNDPRNSR